MSISPVLIATAGGVLLFLLLIGLITSRIKVAGPNEAFIVTGRKGRAVTSDAGLTSHDLSGQKVVLGASIFVLPVVQKLYRLDLSSRRIPVAIRGAISSQGIKCGLEGVAIVKVGGTEAAIRAAAQRFLHQQKDIETFTSEVLAGSLRSIVGRLTVNEIITDRAAFASAVAEEAETSLTNQGLALDTFQLQDISAEGQYLEDLGRPEAARVQKEAAIAEARAKQESERERFLAEEQIAISERQLSLKQASIQVEIDTARAQSDAAGPLAAAEREQMVLAEREKVAVRNAALTERQLEAEVRKPADAQRYRVEQEAEAHKNATIAAADAERQRRTALAEALEREGAAEASAILAKGEAEAGTMDQRAKAFAEYGEAAILDLLVQVLPQTIRAASEPLSQVDKMTIISTDGAESLTRSVSSNLAQGLQIGSDLTGVDFGKLLSALGERLAKPSTDGATVTVAPETKAA